MLLSLNAGFWKVEKSKLFLYKNFENIWPPPQVLRREFNDFAMGIWFLIGLFSKSEITSDVSSAVIGRGKSSTNQQADIQVSLGIFAFFEKVNPAAWKVNIKMSWPVQCQLKHV